MIFLKQRRVSLSLIFTISAILERVAIFDDRLEVTSPGMLLNNVSIKKMIEGYSKPRNPAIANAFAYMKIIEKWGMSFFRIFIESLNFCNKAIFCRCKIALKSMKKGKEQNRLSGSCLMAVL